MLWLSQLCVVGSESEEMGDGGRERTGTEGGVINYDCTTGISERLKVAEEKLLPSRQNCLQ
jgi:hypothetical protein